MSQLSFDTNDSEDHHQCQPTAKTYKYPTCIYYIWKLLLLKIARNLYTSTNKLVVQTCIYVANDKSGTIPCTRRSLRNVHSLMWLFFRRKRSLVRSCAVSCCSSLSKSQTSAFIRSSSVTCSTCTGCRLCIAYTKSHQTSQPPAPATVNNSYSPDTQKCHLISIFYRLIR